MPAPGLVVPALCALALAAPAGCERAKARSRPNVLLISIDTLRADHVGCYGYPRDTTPNLDAVARQGTRFAQHISNTSWTLPSHLSLLTGLPETVHGVESDARALDPARETLAEVLSRHGYRTAGFFSGPYLSPAYGFAQGFERYESVMGLSLPADVPDDWNELAPEDRVQAAVTRSNLERTGEELLSRATAFLGEERDDPFFLFLHFFDCHWDYVPPEPYWRRYDPDYDGDLDPTRIFANPRMRPGMPEEDLEHVIARYDGEIRYTDEIVGRVLSELERLGLADDTLLVITADHGEEFFDHGRFGHRFALFDESLRVPLVVRFPGRVPEGLVVEEQTSVADVMPTILELCGVPRPAEVRGMSLVSLLRGDPEPALLCRPVTGRLARAGEESASQRFARTNDWKLIAARAGEAEVLYYFDLRADPHEQRPRVFTPDKGEPPPEIARAYAWLEQRERADRRFAGTLRLDAPGARPTVDARLLRQLVENGYIGE